MGRPTWLAAGVVVGVGGTIWAEQRVRRRLRRVVDRLTPAHVAGEAAGSARQVGARVRVAVATGREERSRREAELWDRLRDEPVRPGPAAAMVSATAPATANGAGNHPPASRRRRRDPR